MLTAQLSRAAAWIKAVEYRSAPDMDRVPFTPAHPQEGQILPPAPHQPSQSLAAVPKPPVPVLPPALTSPPSLAVPPASCTTLPPPAVALLPASCWEKTTGEGRAKQTPPGLEIRDVHPSHSCCPSTWKRCLPDSRAFPRLGPFSPACETPSSLVTPDE